MPSNPFNVGTVRPAQYMFGRSDELSWINWIADTVQADQEAHRRCFLGAPGTGKTSILKYAQEILRRRNWLCGYSEASPDAATAIGEFLHDARRALPRHGSGQKFLSRITEMNVSFGGVGAGFKVSEGSKPTYSLVLELFAALGDVAIKQRSGVAILLDEAQALPDSDLDLLIRCVSRLERFPVALIMAGLPSIPDKLEREDGPTSAVTWFSTLRPLDRTDAYQALAAPFLHNGKMVSDREINRMLDFAEGHPLTLQMLGSKVWDCANKEQVAIDDSHATRAIESTREQLLIAYHEPMWRRCAGPERDVLAKFAAAPQPIDYYKFIASHWKTIPDVDSIIYRLRDRGVVHMRGTTSVEFSIPGFRDYVCQVTHSSS
jgi:hypothetical protein